MPVLESIGTAVPEEAVRQDDLRDVAATAFADRVPDIQALLDVFDNTRIRTRHLAEPLDWYLEEHGWRDRADAYARHGLPLVTEAATRAMERAGVGPTEVDAIVFVSTTGITTPSLDARLADVLGFRADVSRLPVWGLGCAGGVAGLTRAREIALARPESRVLVVSLELCSLWFTMRRLDKRAVVASTLFSDGAAAALVAGDDAPGAPRSPALVAGASHLFPRSERVMGWDVTDEGLDVVFDRSIPQIVAQNMRPLTDAFLKTHAAGVRPDQWLLHPGGAKVLAAYADALNLPDGALADAEGVLRDYGNMSSPTVLFVAERALSRAPLERGERALLSALGPGFAAEFHLLEGR